MPLFMPPSGLAAAFFRSIWPAALVFLVILLGLDVFYGLNSRLLLLLEREDWPALAQYLENRIIRKGRYSPRLVRLLANTYLVLSDSAAVLSLENKLAVVKPPLVEANALVFGAARILGKDYAGAARFFAERSAIPRGESSDWVRWYYGFSLLLDRRFSEAADQFMPLTREAGAVVTGLAAFFLEENLGRALPGRRLEITAAAMDGRNRVKKAFPEKKNWDREVSRAAAEVHAAVVSKYINEATAWLYREII
jgi:hypothetical protein